MSIPVRPLPGTFFEWEDRSDIVTPDIEEVYTNPLFCAVFTSDKGSEEWQVLNGQDWFNMYAINSVVDFDKHGQALLQTAMTINAGGTVLSKRVVAEAARLANLCVVATVEEIDESYTDEYGRTIYVDSYGNTTTNETNSRGEPNDTAAAKVRITYKYVSVEDCTTMDEVVDAIRESEDFATENVYPLFVICDNGRGASRKRIRFTPNYQLSKNYDNFFLYDFTVMEGNTNFPSIHFALNPDTVYTGSNLSFQYKVNTESDQVKAFQFDEKIKEFIAAVSGRISEDPYIVANVSNIEGVDLMFGSTKKGKPISSMIVNPKTVYDDTGEPVTSEGVDLSIISGQTLNNGSFGSFGTHPIRLTNNLEYCTQMGFESVEAGTEAYAARLARGIAGYVMDDSVNPNTNTILQVKDEDGCYDPIIYNVDRYKIDIIFDANYPPQVKRAIEKLVTFREDCMFFRDMGTAVNSIDLIREYDSNNLHDKFCASYCTYYDVIDPYSRKQITVTMMYHMAQMAVNHFNNSRTAPMAGIKYGFTIDDLVEGTIGFTPTICPGLNEKEDLYDMRVNYATYIDNTLVIESLYTSQEKYTQLSFSNNILAVQQVIKQIRSRCPASRYSFIDGEDLAKYQSEVEGFIEPFRSNFRRLEVTYLEDPYYTANKIFYAALAVQFRDFVQTEFFKITALSSTEI